MFLVIFRSIIILSLSQANETKENGNKKETSLNNFKQKKKFELMLDYHYDEYKLMKHTWENTKHLRQRTLFKWKN